MFYVLGDLTSPPAWCSRSGSVAVIRGKQGNGSANYCWIQPTGKGAVNCYTVMFWTVFLCRGTWSFIWFKIWNNTWHIKWPKYRQSYMKTKSLELVRKDTFVVTRCHLLVDCAEKINLLSVTRSKSNLLRRLRPSDQRSFKKLCWQFWL